MVWCRTFCVRGVPDAHFGCCHSLGSLLGLTFVSKSQSQVKHEARGAGNAASFFADGVTATISTAAQVLQAKADVRLLLYRSHVHTVIRVPARTQKAKEALGMSKPLSQNEDMKPAGGMETQCAPCWLVLYRHVICVARPFLFNNHMLAGPRKQGCGVQQDL